MGDVEKVCADAGVRGDVGKCCQAAQSPFTISGGFK